MIQANDPQLYRAYCMKESLRLLLKSTDIKQAEIDLNRWLWWASHSRIPAFHALYKKIKRHKGHILNTIRLGLSNARIEAINNKIKLIIRKYVMRRKAVKDTSAEIKRTCEELDALKRSIKSEDEIMHFLTGEEN